MKVKFETIFFRQMSAAVMAATVHTMIFKDLGQVLGVYLFYVTAVCLQEWVIEKYKERRRRNGNKNRNETNRTRSNEAGKRKCA